MKTINDIQIVDEDVLKEKYKFQPELTLFLDNLNNDFDQDIINQIILWKVNRYSSVDNEIFTLLNQIKKEDKVLDIDITKSILSKLLQTKGIQLAMASTILRFKNPHIYQIIDQRVYRFINGENLPNYFSTISVQIELYIEYLQKLRQVCIDKNLSFHLSDRIIYELDKEHNKNEKIRY